MVRIFCKVSQDPGRSLVVCREPIFNCCVGIEMGRGALGSSPQLPLCYAEITLVPPNRGRRVCQRRNTTRQLESNSLGTRWIEPIHLRRIESEQLNSVRWNQQLKEASQGPHTAANLKKVIDSVKRHTECKKKMRLGKSRKTWYQDESQSDFFWKLGGKSASTGAMSFHSADTMQSVSSDDRKLFSVNVRQSNNDESYRLKA